MAKYTTDKFMKHQIYEADNAELNLAQAEHI